MDYFVDEKNDGRTVLDIVKHELSISSGHLKHLKFIEGGILVNREHATVRKVLRAGDILTLATEDDFCDGHIEPAELPLDIAYEDADCVVPSKSADMPTHPSHGHYGDTVANALAYKYSAEGIPFVFRPVNRLDRNTSGLLLIAKNRIAAGILSDAMRRGEIKKVYIAILSGRLPENEGYIETYMRRTAESIIVRENCKEGEGGDYALTKYKVLMNTDSHTLVAASPITGRTHQLRVHFAGKGAPILGDDMYGESSSLIDRHGLHSALLSFPRACDGERVTAVSRLPLDMERAAEKIFDGFGTADIYSECETFLSEIQSISAEKVYNG